MTSATDISDREARDTGADLLCCVRRRCRVGVKEENLMAALGDIGRHWLAHIADPINATFILWILRIFDLSRQSWIAPREPHSLQPEQAGGHQDDGPRQRSEGHDRRYLRILQTCAIRKPDMLGERMPPSLPTPVTKPTPVARTCVWKGAGHECIKGWLDRRINRLPTAPKRQSVDACRQLCERRPSETRRSRNRRRMVNHLTSTRAASAATTKGSDYSPPRWSRQK